MLITVKMGQILLRSGHTNVFLVYYDQSRHSSCTELSHAQMCMQNIAHTLIWNGCDISYLMHFHFQVIQNNIMDCIDHVSCIDLIWTTSTWYAFCAHKTTTKFGKSLVNHYIRRSRVRIIFIERGLGFW